MKKNEYDALSKVLNLLETTRGRVDEATKTAQVLAEEVGATVTSTLDRLIEKVGERFEASPLEDPVVPTAAKSGWEGFTDKVGNVSRTDKEDYVIDSARKAGNAQFSDEFYVRGLSDKTLDTVYNALKVVEKIVDGLKKGL